VTSSTAPAQVTTPWRTAKPRSLWQDAARAFAKNKAGMLGLIVACIVFLTAIFAPLIAPYDYAEQDWDHLREPPSRTHIMGTDVLGRDIFSRVIFSIRTAVLVACIVTFSTAVIGVLVGAMGPLIGGWVDAVAVWIMDGLLNFPALWLAAFISVVTRPTITRLTENLYARSGWQALRSTVLLDYLVVFSALSFVWWAGLGRLVRGQVLSLREREFIEAQRAIGASPWWITTRHLVPNVLGQVIVQMSTGFGQAMLVESSLSFLGIGIRPPGASLGQMINAGSPLWRSDTHLVAMPGLTLAAIVLAFVFVGDGLNDALNPRARER
jgi:ABC-type dipeptide/oligopeptide/nickel transport system permease subunit